MVQIHLKTYKEYLIKVSLSGAFGGSADTILNKLIGHIQEHETFFVDEIFELFKQSNKSVEITKSRILGLSYKSNELHLLFNLWYGFNYQPIYHGNFPTVDHIFPTSLLKRIRMRNPETGGVKEKYPKVIRDQVANLMLLSAAENGAGGKADTPPNDWFKNKSEEYLDLHLIPKNPELWELENFERFLEERKKLILNKFKGIIY